MVSAADAVDVGEDAAEDAVEDVVDAADEEEEGEEIGTEETGPEAQDGLDAVARLSKIAYLTFGAMTK